MDSSYAVPFFQSTDPRLRSAYSYGDPRGGSYPDPSQLFSPNQEESEREEEVDHHSSTDYDDDPIPLRYNERGGISGDAAMVDVDLLNQDDQILDPNVIEYEEFPSSDDDGEFNLTERRSARGGKERARKSGRVGARGASKNAKATRQKKMITKSVPKRSRPRKSVAIKGPAADEEDDSIRRPRRRKRKEPVQTPEFKRLNGLVTQAYMREDNDAALEYALEAIQLDPAVFALHAIIAEILNKKGRPQDAMGALFAGVHSSRDPKDWWYAIDRLNVIDVDDREKRQKLAYCYATLVTLDSNDYKARKKRAHLYFENTHWKRAKNDCEHLLRVGPTDGVVIRLYAKVCIELDEPESAVSCFEEFIKNGFEEFIQNFILKGNDQADEEANGAVDEGAHKHILAEWTEPSPWDLLGSYLDLLVLLEDFPKALKVCRTLSRKILGRQKERYWDKYDDDREWDFYPEPRRVLERQFKHTYDEESYGFGLPIEFRIRLGILRILSSKGDDDTYFQEGLSHLEYLLPSEDEEGWPVEDYADTYKEAGDCLRETGHHVEALRFYDPLLSIADRLDSRFYFDIAICYQALGQADDVRSAINHIRYGDDNPMAQIGLAKLYQKRKRFDLMWRLVLQLKARNAHDLLLKEGLPLTRPKSISDSQEADILNRIKNAPGPKLKNRPGPRSKAAKARRQEEENRNILIKDLYRHLKTLEAEAKDGDATVSADWMRIAAELFEEFRSQSRFFPRDKSKPYMGDSYTNRNLRIEMNENEVMDHKSIEFEKPKEWRNISLDSWAELLAHYAIALAHRQDKKKCWEVIKIAENATVIYPEPHRYQLFRIASLSCALRLNDEEKTLDECRWFCKSLEFVSDSFRLPSAAVRSLQLMPTVFRDGPEQKFWMRQVKLMDFSVLPEEHKNLFHFTDGNRVKFTESGRPPGNPYDIKELDPEIFALYGHQMNVSGSPVTALNYYFRAYALKPDDAMLNLCLGLSYIELAFKRQTVNRQYQIQQALTFVSKYYEYRRGQKAARYLQEAEFNSGLIWHSLGLLHLAWDAYDRCMELSEAVRQEAADSTYEDFTIEAALAKRSILATNGDVQGALKISREYLVL